METGFIPYVICEKDKNTNLADKAYHPDEFLHSKSQLKLDINYYIT
jgi:DNA polymerase elongation subunit (family B)